MICQQLAECIDELEKDTVSTPQQKGNRRETKKTLYKSFPCSDSSRVIKCVEYLDKRQKPGCYENGKSYVLDIGTHEFDCLCLHIDGGVIDTTDCRKCDFAFFLKDSDQRVILIELKGSAVGDALDQLKSTLHLDMLQNVLKSKKVYGRIASTSTVPNIYTRDQLALQKEFMRHNGNLKIGKAIFTEKYSRLDVV